MPSLFCNWMANMALAGPHSQVMGSPGERRSQVSGPGAARSSRGSKVTRGLPCLPTCQMSLRIPSSPLNFCKIICDACETALLWTEQGAGCPGPEGLRTCARLRKLCSWAGPRGHSQSGAGAQALLLGCRRELGGRLRAKHQRTVGWGPAASAQMPVSGVSCVSLELQAWPWLSWGGWSVGPQKQYPGLWTIPH